VADESRRARANAVASALRARGIAAEVAPSAAKFGKQIRHADRRGIPFVWFPGDGEHEGAGSDGGDSVKDIRSGEQLSADAEKWMPAAQDLWPTVRTVFTSDEEQGS
jgi:histidyl-tRNA synthetase